MAFQFGTNWSYFSHYVGDAFGAPLAIEMYLMIHFSRLGPSALHTGRYHFERGGDHVSRLAPVE